MQKFKNKESNTHVCNLYYRVMPSELNTFVRINGDNGWVDAFEKLTFETKEDFVGFVSEFVTRGDIRDYLNKKNGELWRHP